MSTNPTPADRSRRHVNDTAPDQMVAETPIFARTLDEWLDTHDNRPPGDVERGPTIVREVKTPLMDDVEQHGIGPWDDKRRKALGSAVVNLKRRTEPKPRPRAATKRATPRQRVARKSG